MVPTVSLTGHIGLLCLLGALANYSQPGVGGAVRLWRCAAGQEKPLLSMDKVELEWRPRQPLMLKEWLELEYSAELSRDGFGCYPRHLATEPRSAGCRRSHVIARVSAALRAALSRPPSARQVEAVALPGSLPARLRVVGFWKKRRGEMEETDRQVASCSATAASSGRRDGACSLATSPRRMGQESRQAGGDHVGLGGGRRSHETVVGIPYPILLLVFYPFSTFMSG